MSVTPEQDDRPRCELCGEPMPQGEEMFKFHGYSGPCPKPPLPRPPSLAEASQRLLDLINELPEEPGGQQDRVFAAYEFDDLRAALAALPKAPSPTPGEVEEALALDRLLSCARAGDRATRAYENQTEIIEKCEATLRAALSRCGGLSDALQSQQPAPREIEEALLFLEADFLVRYGPDEILQCSRCDGFASPEEHDGPVRHKTGCPVCRRIATLRASTRQQWSQRVPDVPGHVRIWGIYWLPNASQWCEPFRLPRDLAIRSVSESHSTVWMFWHQPEVPELPPPPAAEPRDGG